MIPTKRLGLVGLFMALALVASACQRTTGPGQPDIRQGGVFRVELSEPGSLDPPNGDDSEEIIITRNIFEGLVVYDDKTAETKPGVALSWTQNDDATVFTFTLRRDAKFSNGEPVTAQSFVRGWNRATSKSENTELAYHLAGVKGYKENHDDGTAQGLSGLRAVDDHTLEVTLSETDPEFVIKAGHTVFSPVPSDQVIASQQPSFDEFPIGNGPFMLKGPEPWKHNQEIRMVPNPDYVGGRPKPTLEEVVFQIFADIETAYLEWQAGNLDWTRIPPPKIREARAQYAGSVIEKTFAGLTYLSTVDNKAPTDNKLFRQAISMAVDREAINQAVFGGLQQPADSIVPPLIPGYRQGACKYCKHDKDMAKQLFQQSGVNISGAFPLHFNSGAGHEQWMQAVADQIKTNLGIETELVGKTPFSEYLGFLGSFETPGSAPGSVNRLGWGMDYPTPQNFLFPLLHSSSADNHSYYRNPQYEGLLSNAAREKNTARRIAIYQQAEDIALEDMALIPMWFRVQIRLVNNDKYSGIDYDPFEDPTFTTIRLK